MAAKKVVWLVVCLAACWAACLVVNLAATMAGNWVAAMVEPTAALKGVKTAAHLVAWRAVHWAAR